MTEVVWGLARRFTDRSNRPQPHARKFPRGLGNFKFKGMLKMTKSRNIGRGGARPKAGRPKKVRQAEMPPGAPDPAPRPAFSTQHIPDLTATDVRRLLATILLNPAMPPTARVAAGRALLGRDDGSGAEAAAAAELHRKTLEILNRKVN
jgi:hypothetical protein